MTSKAEAELPPLPPSRVVWIPVELTVSKPCPICDKSDVCVCRIPGNRTQH